MNHLKKTLLFVLSLFSINISYAQNALKEPSTFQLKNGMTVIVSENVNSEKAFSSFSLDLKAFPNKKNGIVELLNAVINEGVIKKANMVFNDNSGKLSSLSENLANDLSVFSSAIIHTDINKNNFEAGKAKLISSLKYQDYDYDQSVTEKAINALSLSDLQDFYKQITPDKTYLTLVGAIKLNDAKVSAKKAFGTWNTESYTVAK